MGRTAAAGDELTAAEEILIGHFQAGDGQDETPSGTIDGANVTFTLTRSPSPAVSLKLVLNGAVQERGAGKDYTLSGETITFVTAPLTGSIMLAWYLVDTDT